MTHAVPCYKRHRFAPEIIAHAVWLYLRFSFGCRAVEEMLLERGVEVSHETLRRWVIRFGPAIARGLRRRAYRSGDIWHLDEAQATIRGEKFRLWRAVDQNGLVLDEILRRDRDAKAARRLLKSLLRKTGRPPRRMTCKLRSYGAAERDLAPGLERRSHKGPNNRAGNSHPPSRSRERVMRRHRSPGGLQRVVAMHSATRNCLVPPRHRTSAQSRSYPRLEALGIWREAAGVAA